MLFKRVTLFHFFGFPVKADGSWIFMSVLIAWTMATHAFPRLTPGLEPEVYQIMGIATLAGILVSIIAHEVAHAVIAEYYHMPIESITLFIFGGVAEMKGPPSNAKGEFLMALAGPAMSGLMALFFTAAASLLEIYLQDNPATTVLQYLGWINMLIAGFNMLPAFPLDGGRALRAAIWHYRKNLVLATRIASELGAVFAYAMLAYACYKIVMENNLVSGMWTGLLGYFVHAAGAHAVRQTESRSLLGREKVSRFAYSNVVTVPPDLTIAELVEKYMSQHYQRSFPVIDRNMLAGIISLQSVLALPRDKWPWLHVSSLMERDTAAFSVPPDFSAADALETMQKQGRDMLLISDGGKFLGIVTMRDLATYLSISLKIDQNRPLLDSDR